MKIIEEPNKIPTVSAFDMEVGQVGKYHYTGFEIEGFTEDDICVRDSAGLYNLSNPDFRIGVDLTLKKCRIKPVPTVHPAQTAALIAWDLKLDYNEIAVIVSTPLDYSNKKQYCKGAVIFRAGNHLCNVTARSLLRDYFVESERIYYPDFKIRILPKGTKIEL